MSRVAVIDSDPLIYIVGFSNDGATLEYQCQELDSFIDKIVDRSGCDKYVGFLTGKGNFREQVATIQPYKGNRDKSHRPEFYSELRQYLIDIQGMELVEGMEADDAVGIYHCTSDGPSVICTLDKDLDMIPGEHYNYKTDDRYYVDETTAYQNFYLQVLTGDPVDNIPGLYKVTGKRATKKIKEPILSMEGPAEMDVYCWEAYMSAEGGKEDSLDLGVLFDRYKEIKTLLWIRRE